MCARSKSSHNPSREGTSCCYPCQSPLKVTRLILAAIICQCLNGDLPVKVTGGAPAVIEPYQSWASSSVSASPFPRLVERFSWNAEGWAKKQSKENRMVCGYARNGDVAGTCVN